MKNLNEIVAGWKALAERIEVNESDAIDRDMWERNRPRSIWEVPAKSQVSATLHGFIDSLEKELCLEPGDTLLVGVNKKQTKAIVYRLRHDDARTEIQIHSDTWRAWQDARAAVPRSGDCFVATDNWPALTAIPTIRPLRNARPAANVWSPFAIDGRSFGLGFAISIASRLLGLPLRDDVVALAGCYANGDCHEVAGLEKKIERICEVAPRIQKFVVYAEQPDIGALRSTFPTLEICGVENLQNALLQVFPVVEVADLDQTVVSALDEPIKLHIKSLSIEQLERQTNTLFSFMLFEEFLPNSFGGIAKVATFIHDELSARPDQNDFPGSETARKLNFVYAVASRHEGAFEELAMPIEWCGRLPRPQQWASYAHYVQHGYDHGFPSGGELRGFFSPIMPNSAHDADRDQLRFLGAWARLGEREGKFREGLDRQIALIRSHIDYASFEQTSFPMSQAYHLVALLADDDAFDELESLRERVLRLLPAGYPGVGFIQAARFRAAVSLPTRRDTAVNQASELDALLRAADHLRGAVNRYLVRLPIADIGAERRDDAFAQMSSVLPEWGITALLGEFEKAEEEEDRGEQKALAGKMAKANNLFAALYEAIKTSPDLANQRDKTSVERLAVNAYPY